MLQAIWSPVAYAQVARAMARPTRSGYPTAHSSARIPPIEPPRTAANRSIRSRSANAASAATWSRMVIRGNREPFAGRPALATTDR